MPVLNVCRTVLRVDNSSGTLSNEAFSELTVAPFFSVVHLEKEYLHVLKSIFGDSVNDEIRA